MICVCSQQAGAWAGVFDVVLSAKRQRGVQNNHEGRKIHPNGFGFGMRLSCSMVLVTG